MKIEWAFLFFSLAFHALFLAAVSYYAATQKTPESESIKISIVTPKVQLEEEKKPPPLASLPPKPVKPKPRKVPPKPEPVQGFAPSAVSPSATGGIAVPMGNTMMKEDEGKRLAPAEVKEFTGDLSSDARLIHATVTVPLYTDEAIEAGIEGVYIVEVFVNERGEVTDLELRKKVGHGMDEKLLAAARQARFEPRRDRYGNSISGWTQIPFDLRIE